jgi:hypothetical protein
MNIFSNRSISKIPGEAFHHATFGKDESIFQSLFGLPQMLAITQGVKGVNGVHSVAQEAFTQFGFS